MELVGTTFLLRPWRADDRESLVQHANNRNVWRNLGDVFPHPYTLADADEWIEAREQDVPPHTMFAIVVDGAAVGGIGFNQLKGALRMTAGIGYWLGEDYWGRGIATEALKLVTEYAFSTFKLRRLEAVVYPWNPASARVLEKAGYEREGRLRKSHIKNGRPVDVFLYAIIR